MSSIQIYIYTRSVEYLQTNRNCIRFLFYIRQDKCSSIESAFNFHDKFSKIKLSQMEEMYSSILPSFLFCT